jgi:hypothetical protein
MRDVRAMQGLNGQELENVLGVGYPFVISHA